MRNLRETDGTEWQIWKVTPDPRGLWELRRGERRRSHNPNYPGDERRMSQDRRCGSTLADGWLCFQSSTEKRRLTPIPPDWESCHEETLSVLLRAASPIKMRLGI
jgi:hypothetical protein